MSILGSMDAPVRSEVKRIIMVALLFVLPVLTSILWWQRRGEQRKAQATAETPLVIAVVAPQDNPKGIAIANAAKLFAAEQNLTGGIAGHPLRIEVIDDAGDTNAAVAAATKAATGNALAVIGHLSSSASIAGSPIYKANSIVAITPSATNDKVTADNPWMFSAIFNDSQQGKFLAAYVQHGIDADSVTVYKESGVYGEHLARVFEEQAKDGGLRIASTVAIGAAAAPAPVATQAAANAANAANAPVPAAPSAAAAVPLPAAPPAVDATSVPTTDAVFVAANVKNGAAAIVALRNAGYRGAIVGPDALASDALIAELATLRAPNHELEFYTNELYVAMPLIYDTANAQAQRFRKAYLQQYRTEPLWHAGYAYDALAVVARGLANTNARGAAEQKAAEREALRKNLASLGSVHSALIGVTGVTYFTSERYAPKSLSMAIYRNGFVSALAQIKPVRYVDTSGTVLRLNPRTSPEAAGATAGTGASTAPSTTDNATHTAPGATLPQQSPATSPPSAEKVAQTPQPSGPLASSEATPSAETVQPPPRRPFRVGSGFMARTDVVYTGMRMRRISAVNFAKDTADVEFDLWFRYQAPLDAKRVEFPNAVGSVDIGPAVLSSTHGRLAYEAHRVKGTFKLNSAPGPAPPLEQHIVSVGLRHAFKSANEILYVADVLGLEQNGTSLTQEGPSIDAELKLGVKDSWLAQEVSKRHVLGDPTYLFAEGATIDQSTLFASARVAPTTFTVRRRLNVSLADNFLLAGVLGVFFLYVAGRFTARRPKLAAWLWLFECLAWCAVVLLAEVFVLEIVVPRGNRTYVAPAVKAFDVLWWGVLAVSASTGFDRLIWGPIETRSGRPIPRVAKQFASWIVWIICGFGVLAFAFNQKITGLLATSGLIAMIIGLAIQMNISNIFSGIVLNLERPFRIGDWVEIGGKLGQVVDVSWRATKLQPRSGEVISIPNAVAAATQIINYSFPNPTIAVRVDILLDPIHSPDTVEAILLEAIKNATPEIKEAEPGCEVDPHASYQGVDQRAALYRVGTTISRYENRGRVIGALNKHVWRLLNANGMRLISQQTNVRMANERSNGPGNESPDDNLALGEARNK